MQSISKDQRKESHKTELHELKERNPEDFWWDGPEWLEHRKNCPEQPGITSSEESEIERKKIDRDIS